jgi:hypothetical protein
MAQISHSSSLREEMPGRFNQSGLNAPRVISQAQHNKPALSAICKSYSLLRDGILLARLWIEDVLYKPIILLPLLIIAESRTK